MHYNFIAIEGNIGSGKTSLAKMLGEDMKASLILEEFADNPFLPKFYKNPEKYAFPLELSFLAERYHQLKERLANTSLFSELIVSDYYIAKSMIFSRTNLSKDEYRLFQKMFEIMDANLPRPDLLVYLYKDIDLLQENIKKRGRHYEQKIPDEYLIKVQESYLNYIRQNAKMPVLVIDTNKLDFVKNPQDYEKLHYLLSQKYAPGMNHITA